MTERLECEDAGCGCRAHNGFLTAKGLAETAQQFSLEGLAPRGVSEYVDRLVSVSGARRDETFWLKDDQIDSQYRRFLEQE